MATSSVGAIFSIDWHIVVQDSVPILVTAILLWLVKVVFDNRIGMLNWFKKVRLILFPVTFNLGISINANRGLNSLLYKKEVIDGLNKSIERLALKNEVIAKDFSDVCLFFNKKEAEKFRQGKGLDLLIWGEFSSDGLMRNGQNVNEVTLNFTYGYPKFHSDTENNIGKMISLDISDRLAIKNYWQIIKDNSIDDVKIVSNNLGDISLYILGLTLKFFGRITESKCIFENLMKDLLFRRDSFSELVKPHLIEVYNFFIDDYTYKPKYFEKGIELCKKILEIEEKNLAALVSLAFFSYHLQDHATTEKIIKKMFEFYPRSSVVEVDVAFLRILQGNYKNAYKHYNRIASLGSVEFNPLQIVAFLGAEFERLKEPALLYGSGFISLLSGQRELAKKDFEEFLKKADKVEYKEMIRGAKRLLIQINKQ